MSHIAGDERGVVVEWFAKLLVGLVLAGIVVFDVGAIVVNYITLDSTANEIAIELSSDLTSTQFNSVDQVLLGRARQLATDAGARLAGLEIGSEGVLRVRLAREAKTIVVQRVEPIRRWGRARAGAEAATQ
jgi:hypothetical protein